MKIKARRIIGFSLTMTLLFAAAMASHRLSLPTVQSAPVAGKALAAGAAVTNLIPGPAAAAPSGQEVIRAWRYAT